MIYGPSARIVRRIHFMYLMPCRSIFTVIRSNLRVLHGSVRIVVTTKMNTKNRYASGVVRGRRRSGDGIRANVMECEDLERPKQNSLLLCKRIMSSTMFAGIVHVPRHLSQTKTPCESVYHSLIMSVCSCEFVCFSFAPKMAAIGVAEAENRNRAQF